MYFLTAMELEKLLHFSKLPVDTKLWSRVNKESVNKEKSTQMLLEELGFQLRTGTYTKHNLITFSEKFSMFQINMVKQAMQMWRVWHMKH